MDIASRHAPASKEDSWTKQGFAKRALYIIGTILFCASLIYVGVFTARNWPDESELAHFRAAPLLAAAALYALTQFSSSAAWIVGVAGLGQTIPLKSGIKINFSAQIGKYLPGNVAHYFARAALASTAGVSISSSFIATIMEILATVLAGTTAAVVSMIFDPAPLQAVHKTITQPAPMIAAFGMLGACAILVLMRVLKIPAGALLASSACLMVSFVLVGLSFFAVLSAAAPGVLSPIAVIGMFAVAWTAGYVIPGAPAGLGVREAILIAWLAPVVGGPVALASVMVHRLVSAAIDTLCALTGYAWLRAEGHKL